MLSALLPAAESGSPDMALGVFPETNPGVIAACPRETCENADWDGLVSVGVVQIAKDQPVKFPWSVAAQGQRHDGTAARITSSVTRC
jgi:hypothetical protein